LVSLKIQGSQGIDSDGSLGILEKRSFWGFEEVVGCYSIWATSCCAAKNYRYLQELEIWTRKDGWERFFVIEMVAEKRGM